MPTRVAWDLSELRSAVAARPDSAELLDLIFSVDRYTRIFVYHVELARDALEHLIADGTGATSEAVALVLGAHPRQEELEEARIVSEANVIASIHTARNLWDVFAQIVNSLVLSAPLRVDRCDISKVIDALPASDLRTCIVEQTSQRWYEYVVAFTNTAKHRSLVKPLLSVSVTEDRSGIRFSGFQYRGTEFPAYWSREVLEGAIEVKNGLIPAGRMLNQVVLHGA